MKVKNKTQYGHFHNKGKTCLPKICHLYLLPSSVDEKCDYKNNKTLTFQFHIIIYNDVRRITAQQKIAQQS